MQQRRPRLEGKVAIVTGAGARDSGPRVGTGKAISVTFAREGAKVLLVDRVLSNAEDTLASIQAQGGEASVFEGDVTSSAHCEAMVEAARERYGRVDVLVNNAGIFVPEGTVVDVPEDLWDEVLNVNLKSMMLASKFAIPELIKSGGGAIINLSSTGGLRAAKNYGLTEIVTRLRPLIRGTGPKVGHRTWAPVGSPVVPPGAWPHATPAADTVSRSIPRRHPRTLRRNAAWNR